MSIQDLITRYERINNFSDKVSLEKVIEDLNQLDDKEIPIIPQFVADWIDTVKDNYTLYYALDHSPEKVNLWLNEDEYNRQNIFALAWIYDYKIEKEKRYRARIKENNQSLCLDIHGKFYFSDKEFSIFTKSILEGRGFGWIFNVTEIEMIEVVNQ